VFWLGSLPAIGDIVSSRREGETKAAMVGGRLVARGRDGYGALRGLWLAPALALERIPRATCDRLAPVRETGAPAGGAGVWVCSGLRARPPQGDQKLIRQTIITPFD